MCLSHSWEVINWGHFSWYFQGKFNPQMAKFSRASIFLVSSQASLWHDLAVWHQASPCLPWTPSFSVCRKRQSGTSIILTLRLWILFFKGRRAEIGVGWCKILRTFWIQWKCGTQSIPKQSDILLCVLTGKEVRECVSDRSPRMWEGETENLNTCSFFQEGAAWKLLWSITL